MNLMKRHRWILPFLGLALLHARAGADVSATPTLAIESIEGGGREAVALGPRILRFPQPAKPPTTNKPPTPKTKSPAAELPAAQQPTPAVNPAPASSAHTSSQQKPATSTPAAKGFLDPKLARTLFDQGMAEAKRRFPHLHGKPKQKHHVHPIYLGGLQNGPTVDLDPAYHQLITNAFREEFKYGQIDPPQPAEQQRIMRKVYSRYPLPGIHF